MVPGAAARRSTTGARPAAGHVGSLREVAVRSGAYLVGREAVGMLVRLGGLVVVVREIGPSQFGIYSAAAAFVYFAAALAQMGAEVYLVRVQGPVPRRRYDEVFTFLLCTSAVVVAVGLALSYALAPWIRPVGVLAPLRVLLLSVPINILWAPSQAAIERRFAYRRMGLLELGGDVALYATAVSLALVGAGAWSLIAGYFAWQAWLLAGSMVLSGIRPKLAWSPGTARALLRHGTTYAVSTWIQGARGSIVTLIVGTFAGAAGVGLVNFALRLVMTLNFTDRGVHRVGLVAISKARKDQPGRMAGAVEEGMLLLMVVAALPFAAFGAVAHWVVPDVFGAAWLPALPVYVLLAAWAVLRVPATVQRTLLYAYGRNAPPAVTSAIELVIVAAVSMVTVHTLGIVGFGYASVLGVTSTLYTHHAARREVPVRYRRLAVPLLGLVPVVLVPVLPLPWGYLLLTGPLLLLASATTRGELRHLVATARMAIARRSARSPAPAPVAMLGAGAEVVLNGTSRRGLDEAVLSPIELWPPAGPVTRAGGPAPAAGAFGADPPAAATTTDPDRDHVAEGAPPRPVGAAAPDPLLELLAANDPVTGLPSAGVLLARLGRRLGVRRIGGWELVVAGIDISPRGPAQGASPRTEEDLAAAAGALRRTLRFDDPVARVGPSTFVAAVAFVSGGTDGAAVAHQLGAAVADALGARLLPMAASPDEGGDDPPRNCVRVAHVTTRLPSSADADQLVRRAVEALHA